MLANKSKTYPSQKKYSFKIIVDSRMVLNTIGIRTGPDFYHYVMATRFTDAELRVITQRTALAFIEDAALFRKFYSRPEILDRSAIRNLSASLRRLLIEGEIYTIAKCRIGRVTVEAKKTETPAMKANATLGMFVNGGANIPGGYSGGSYSVVIEPGGFGDPHTYFHMSIGVYGTKLPEGMTRVQPHDRTTMTLSNFLSQKVVYFDSSWANRKDVIKYIALRASGVHSDIKRANRKDELLQAIELAFQIAPKGRIEGNLEHLNHRDVKAKKLPSLEYNANHLSPALFELLAIADFFYFSPEIVRLEEIIRGEITNKC